MPAATREALLAETKGLKREIKLLNDQVKELKEDKETYKELLKQVNETLAFSISPDLYNDQSVPYPTKELTPEEKVLREHKELEGQYLKDLIENTEAPLFRDASDLDNLIQGLQISEDVEAKLEVTQAEPAPSIHGNLES